jgi:biotin transport system substrate-specific component
MNTRGKIVYPVLSCLFAALICVGAYIAIPLPGIPVPIVLQNLFVMLAAVILGPVWGLATVALYLFLGIIGLPVFSAGTGGLARLWGPTGGFLIGYIPACLAMGSISRIGKFAWWKILIAILAGTAIHYSIGIPVLAVAVKVSFAKAIAIGFLPFIAGDAIKIAVALPVALAIKPWLDERLGKETPHG